MEIEDKKIQKRKNDEKNLPWVEKYRPDTLNDLLAHKSIVETIQRFITENKLPNLLFYGPPGTGKTSTIIALAKQIYGPAYKGNVLEMNASDDRGIGAVRDQIKTFVSTQQISFQKQTGPKKPKLVILDEADNMTNSAQFALRRLIEKYSGNARFCMICNYVSKIIPALQSRCTRFKFRHLQLVEAETRIVEICEEEKIQYKKEGIEAIFSLCEGDMRRVVNMLQALNLSLQSNQQDLTAKYVYHYTGNITPEDLQNIQKILLTDDMATSYKKIRELQAEKGISVQILLKELNTILMDTKLESRSKAFIISRLADIEYRMSINGDEKIQLMSLIGAYIEIRHTIN